ncbi:unnamed protein product [Leptosia nina]|uniref:Uncharacterized protein n=1 Tax=Leptosia nina TaxID=320188 RepID=A0AAV1JVL4_9NEOP
MVLGEAEINVSRSNPRRQWLERSRAHFDTMQAPTRFFVAAQSRGSIDQHVHVNRGLLELTLRGVNGDGKSFLITLEIAFGDNDLRLAMRPRNASFKNAQQTNYKRLPMR